MLPAVVALGGIEDGEVHRAHVERGDFGLGAHRSRDPVVHAHAEPAAGGDVEHGVAALLDARQELHEQLRLGRGSAGVGIARVQVNDGSTRLGRCDRGFGDLVRRDRQGFRHGRRMDGAGDGARDDDFALLCHGPAPFSSSGLPAAVLPFDPVGDAAKPARPRPGASARSRADACAGGAAPAPARPAPPRRKR